MFIKQKFLIFKGMKRTLTALACLISVSLSAQYSNYYEVYKKSEVKIEGEIKVNKTVRTIDYGALAQANAQTEANRIAAQRFTNERDREAALAIADDPSKAWDYGSDDIYQFPRKNAKLRGAKKPFFFSHRIPHSSIFTRMGNYAASYENISDDGVVTEIHITGYGNLYMPRYGWGEYDGKSEKLAKFFLSNIEVGQEEEMSSANFGGEKVLSFIHSTYIKKTTVFGHAGFKITTVFENEYEKVIKDYYLAATNGVYYGVTVIS